MAHPYADKAMTGQERADARYDFPPNQSDVPTSPLLDAAKVTSRGEKAEDNFTSAPTRQISESGKVKK